MMTIRLSIINFAGIVRTLVAVGTVRLWSMFAARVLAGPFSGATVSSVLAGSLASSARDAGACAGMGWALGAMEVVFAIGDVTG